MELDIKGSRVLSDLLEFRTSGKRGIVLEGGARSTKTWSIIQMLVLYCLDNYDKGKVITISRLRLTWLKSTLIPDFIRILKMLSLYKEADHNKTSNIYKLFGNDIWFIGLDEEDKLEGRAQDVFWINEGRQATFGDFAQLAMRTREFFILDYNPNFTKHWIIDKVLTRDDVVYNHSTMLDNPFLEQTIIDEINSYEPTPENIRRGTADETKWLIYGLGKRANIEGQIYTKYKIIKDFPPNLNVWYWLDFGFTNDPTAVGRMGLMSGEIYLDEYIYETGLTNTDISSKLIANNISKGATFVADSAEQKSIMELNRMGWNILPADKGPDSIKNGIDILKRYTLNVTERSMNILREIENYVWLKDKQTKEGFSNVPVDNFNHHLDGIRYVALKFLKEKGNIPKPFTVRRHIPS